MSPDTTNIPWGTQLSWVENPRNKLTAPSLSSIMPPTFGTTMRDGIESPPSCIIACASKGCLEGVPNQQGMVTCGTVSLFLFHC